MNQDGQRSVPESDLGQRHKQPTGVPETPGDLPVPLPEGVQGTARHAPKVPSLRQKSVLMLSEVYYRGSCAV